MVKKHVKSFKNAFDGIVWVLRTESNYRVHITLSMIALLLGYLLHISYFEFLVILILIFLGLAIEMLNTAFEEATDAIDKQWREDIKIVKDVAAGAMLIFAVGALLIAGVIFIPKLLFYIQMDLGAISR